MAIVRYKAEELPELTKEDIERIRNIPEDAIDYSDIPPLTEDFWKNAGGIKDSQAIDIKRAKQIGVNRQSLYKSLSTNGNPSFETINQVIHALGLKIAIQPA